MRVLITSGGTTEPIDSVRGISNFATGRLGALTAERFLAAGHEVILLAGDKAALPKAEADDKLFVSKIMGTADLYERMEQLVPRVDVVVHSMAVSDYRPVYMTGLENLPEMISQEELLHFQPDFAKKISSKSNHQIMLLEKTPKIISFIKEWNPKVVLFGFKLLAGVSQDELLKVATDKLISNHADYIVANDLEKINAKEHHAFLVSADKVEELLTKEEIAEKILRTSEAHFHD